MNINFDYDNTTGIAYGIMTLIGFILFFAMFRRRARRAIVQVQERYCDEVRQRYLKSNHFNSFTTDFWWFLLYNIIELCLWSIIIIYNICFILMIISTIFAHIILFLFSSRICVSVVFSSVPVRSVWSCKVFSRF